MKEEGNVMVTAQTIISGASPSPTLTPHSPATQPPLPTPSPYSFSVASTRLRSRPSIYAYDLALRSLALLFSFISALSLAVPSPTRTKRGTISKFCDNPQLTYCFSVSVLAFIYSAFQLFKRVCDIAYRGVLISDKTSDYLSFILDQLTGYLLVSSSSVTIPVIQEMDSQASLWKAAILAVCMSFTAFMVLAVSALLSGYKLCKRIIW
ncbi:CASP-like protein 4A4 isoform X1 [Solanum pennellii]|uniref:CASP-like protein n=1 Tax=Solanum pennellii TaxID=28526 RepID=A0ABM1HFL9_SOLPN|nr:CASP-like protein 4A4 isoform X1 [Solanum pennellii]